MTGVRGPKSRFPLTREELQAAADANDSLGVVAKRVGCSRSSVASVARRWGISFHGDHLRGSGLRTPEGEEKRVAAVKAMFADPARKAEVLAKMLEGRRRSGAIAPEGYKTVGGVRFPARHYAFVYRAFWRAHHRLGYQGAKQYLAALVKNLPEN